MEPLTAPEQQTLDFIKDYLSMKGFAPAVSEMALAAGVTGTAIIGRLRRLEAKGYIYRAAKRARAIVVTTVPPS